MHHSNCNDIWLIFYDSDIIYKYLITNSGVDFKEIINIDRKINNPNNHDIKIHLSSDCKHYTANFLYDSIVCYGDFDRQTGNFVRKSELILHARQEVAYTYILNSIISRDNSKIYYFCETKTKDLRNLIEVMSVNIVNGTPDYENINILYSNYKSKSLYIVYNDIFYGYDGNIYIIYHAINKMYKITSKTDKVEEFLTFDSEYGPWAQDFLADWFSQYQCGEQSPCPEIKPPRIICE